MYLNHFRLDRKPFEQLPDPEFLFLSEKHETALSSIGLAVAIRDSFVVVTGEIGSGKTTMLHKLVNEKLDDATVAYVTQTRLSGTELLQAILVEFGEVPFDKGKVELITTLRRFINKQHRDHKRVVIVVDEAQNLSAGVLEELRLVTCNLPGSDSMVNVVLVGQPQFNRILDSPALEQLRQRCRLRYHLNALTEGETLRYIEHRLFVAGGSFPEIFEPGLGHLIFHHCRGIPRLINMLCDTALIFAFVDKSPRVTSDVVHHAVAELGWAKGGGAAPGEMMPNYGYEGRNLAVLVDADTGMEYPITDMTCVVGRAHDCSVRIKHPALSRYHAMIKQVNQTWTLSDMKSTNGVYLNSQRIRIAKLRHDDHVGIGEHDLVFRLADGGRSQAERERVTHVEVRTVAEPPDAPRSAVEDTE